MNYSSLTQLEKEYGTDFFVLDLEQLTKNYHLFINAFSRHYNNINIGYSYKTNYIPHIIHKINELGAYAEVVSKMEYQLALNCGISPEQIIFNGPLKETPYLDDALTRQSMVNIDNLAEVERVLKIINTYPDKTFQVGLRCNFDLKDGSYSRFGLCLENGDLDNAFNRLNRARNCNVVGLHCHYTTPGRTLESFHYRTQKMVAISRKLFHDKPPAYLDLGGGIFGQMDDQIKQQYNCYIPSYEEYADSIAPVVKKAYPDEEPELIMEPGVGLVSNVLHFYTRIMYLKKINERNYAVCSGSVFNVKPSLHKKHLTIERIPAPGNKHPETKQNYEIVGSTCLEWDKLLEKYQGPLAEGDYIRFLNVGAYTIVFKSPFINYAPPILYSECQNQSLKPAKRCETFEDIVRTYQIKDLQ